jgi:hypothetical protein
MEILRPTSSATPSKIAKPVWWCVWIAILNGLIILYVVLSRRSGEEVHAGSPAIAFIGLVPLTLGTALRWLVLPRLKDPAKAFMVFIVGLAMTEGCGILGIFLGGAHKETLFALGLIGVLQFIPLFLSRFDPQPTLHNPQSWSR